MNTANVRVREQRIDREQISRRAYEIYESRDRLDGHSDKDWLQAETEYEARRERGLRTFAYAGVGGSFGDRTRHARR